MYNPLKKEDALHKAKTLVAVLEEMVAKTPTTLACKNHGVSTRKLHKFLVMDISKDERDEIFSDKTSSPYMEKHKEFYTWEDRFMYNIFGEGAEVLPDFNEAYEIVLETLREREKKVIRLRYEEEMTLDEMANVFGVTRERIRQVLVKAERKIRHPSRAIYFKYGKDAPEVKALQDKVDNYNREKHELLEQLKKDAEILEKVTANLKDQVNEQREKIGLPQNEYELFDIPIEELSLSVRSYNTLRRNGIETVGELSQTSEFVLKRFRGMGSKSFNEIKAVLRNNFNIFLPVGI